MIGVVCKHAAYGAADNIVRAFRSQGIEAELLYLCKDKYGRTEKDNLGCYLNKSNLDHWLSLLSKKENKMFIVSTTTIESIYKHLPKNPWNTFFKKTDSRPSIFITGTMYYRKSERWNHFMDDHNIYPRFCQPELMRYGSKNIQMLHPMEYNDIDQTKNKRITICHSPGLAKRFRKKGGDKIIQGLERAKKEVDFDFKFIYGIPLYECLEVKAKSHIFIDQIFLEVGGLGKNGLEALSLGCITMSSIINFNKNYTASKFYPPHPVIEIRNSDDVYENVVSLLKNKKKFKKMVNKTNKWKECIGYKNTVNYILKNLKNSKEGKI